MAIASAIDFNSPRLQAWRQSKMPSVRLVLLALSEAALVAYFYCQNFNAGNFALMLCLLGWLMRKPKMVSVVLAAFVAMLCCIDSLFGFVINSRIAIGCCGMALLLTAPTYARTHSRRFKTALACTLALLCALPAMNWTVRKTFKRAFAQVSSGMTANEALAIFRHEFGGIVPTHHIGGDTLYLTLDPNQAEFNSEVIELHLADGQIVDKSYWPD